MSAASCRPLMIGEAPSWSGGAPLAGRPAILLAGCCGMAVSAWLATWERVNLFSVPPRKQRGGKGKGFELPPEAAARAASAVDLRGRHVLLLGRRVALAFGVRPASAAGPVRIGRGEASAAVIPHPSGIVRWWNDAGNRIAAGRVMLGVMRRCKAADPACGRPGLPEVTSC